MFSAPLPIQVKKLHPDAVIPKYQTDGAAGADFHACTPNVSIWVAPGRTVRVPTGIAMFIGDPGYVLQLSPRSGLGTKGIILANTIGLIDSDYQGEIAIMLYNRSHEAFEVHHGDRVAQGMFLPVKLAYFNVVDDFDVRTARGAGGFGSTGRNLGPANAYLPGQMGIMS